MKFVPIIMFCFVVLFFNSNAQDLDQIIVSNKTFIKDAFVKVSPFQAIQRKSILIENGLIAKVGTSIGKPNDAVLIEGDTIYVYPAFIDACSHIGQEEEEITEESNRLQEFSYGIKGIRPHFTSSFSFDPKDADIQILRKKGFGISHTVPKGRILPGKGNIILLKDDKSIDILKSDVSFFGQFHSSRNAFPSTPMGTIAVYKDMIFNARYADIYLSKYQKQNDKLERPQYSQEVIASIELANKSKPLFFRSRVSQELERAVRLKEEADINLVLVECKSVFNHIRTIKEHKLSVLLSLDIPKELEELDSSSTSMDSFYFLKKQNVYDQSLLQPKFLHDNQIMFAFSLLDMKYENIWKVFHRYTKAGVSEDILLEGLTTNAAKILGIEKQVGVVEKGKIANMILSSQPIFDENSNVLYMIVEGKVHKYENDKESN